VGIASIAAVSALGECFLNRTPPAAVREHDADGGSSASCKCAFAGSTKLESLTSSVIITGTTTTWPPPLRPRPLRLQRNNFS
jgi:hypothetical protein